MQSLPLQSTHAGSEQSMLPQSAGQSAGASAGSALSPNKDVDEQQQSRPPETIAGWLAGRPTGMTMSPDHTSTAFLIQST